MGRIIWMCAALAAGGFLEGGRRVQQESVDVVHCTHSLGVSENVNVHAEWSGSGACVAFRTLTGIEKTREKQKICPRISAPLCTVSNFEGTDCAVSKAEIACACRLCGFAPIFQSDVEASGDGAIVGQDSEEEAETVNEAMDTIWIALGCMIVVALSLVCCRQCKHVVFPKGNTYRGTPQGTPYPKSGAVGGAVQGRLGGA
mmetsp:Transcript_2500/g.6070  ORF Transcript_2500/g.6070 Transcript_2500/m.6070 type:complete len:201 (+) Transcript_2500:36-638(+)